MPDSRAPFRISVPGKVFLLGEYAVMGGSPAWVATVAPRFRLEAFPSSAWESPFAAESPAGRWIEQWRAEGEVGPFALRFFDAHEGRGGFGGSTAELALVARLAGELDRISLWRRYRELTRLEQGLPPSGADLLAQVTGGVQRVRITRQGEPQVSDLGDSFPFERCVVLSATGITGRKVETHRHLAQFEAGTQNHRDLEQRVADAELALHRRDLPALGACLTAYARSLAEQGLECEGARREREHLSRVPGVLGYKGCGALLSDAAVAFVEDDLAASRLVEEARRLGLRCVTQGLKREPGVLCE